MKLLPYIVFGFTFLMPGCDDDDRRTDVIENDLHAVIAEASIPLNDDGIDSLLHAIGDSRYVLLGEASHGTAEFYEWRAQISQRLIAEKGFTTVAVEGDWPDLHRFNEYIRGGAGANAAEVLSSLDRWPTWMWANEEVAAFGEWLREYNTSQGNTVSFHGIDVYSLWDSMREVLAYVEDRDPALAQLAKNALNCFAPFESQDEFAYGQAKAQQEADCADELTNLFDRIEQVYETVGIEDEEVFNALQNARIAVNAERYYTTAITNNAESWNIRDRHMMETVNFLRSRNADSKIIIWAHNTHVGDARATTMHAEGMVNIGQLAREEHEAEGVFIAGFSSYKGTVIASPSWGAATQTMTVPEARESTWEDLLHEAEQGDKIVFTEALKQSNELMKQRGHRAIGVVYNPSQEAGNYVPTVLANRYDAVIFIEESRALTPLSTRSSSRKKKIRALFD